MPLEKSSPESATKVVTEKSMPADGGEKSTEKKAEAVAQAPTPGNIQEEGFVAAFYAPRTLSGLTLLVLAIVYVVLVEEDRFLGEDRRQSGLVTMASAFLLYCMIQLRDGDLLRPHPAIWRVVHGAALLYFMLLVYLLCQDLAGIQEFLQIFDKEVGTPEVETDYASDCRLYIPEAEDPWVNFKDKFFDRFVIAHFLGWFLKALIIRDWMLMWAASIIFEVLEVSMQHLLPNFAECYWDKLFLDLFGCNLLGMIVGMYTVKYWTTHKFNWTGHTMSKISSPFGKAKRVALQFSPYDFETYRWEVFSSWRHCMIGIAVVIVLLVGEVNAFWIKSVFNIPIKSDLNLYRLALWAPMTYMAVFDFHIFAEGRRRRIGVNAWLASSLVAFETLLVAKHAYRKGMFSRDELTPPNFVLGGWLATLVLLIVFGLVMAVRNVLVWSAGVKEIHDEILREGGRSRTKSFDSIVAKKPESARLIRAVTFLDSLQQILIFGIPIPFLGILVIDTVQSFYIAPTPAA